MSAVDGRTLIGDRFELEATAGSGGMGIVYKARDRHTGDLVALKLLKAEPYQEGDLDRFAREARVLAELRHPGIVSYVSHGVSPEGQPYLAMEWLEGEELLTRLERGALPISDVCALANKAAEALSVAHRRGVVHRDLKPSNLFLRDKKIEGLTLLDFGIARRILTARPLTKTGAFLGTPGYMAPEQAMGNRDVGPEADIFSLGCVLFECLTGRPPFIGEHIVAVMTKILVGAPPAVTTLRPDTPAPLSSLVDRMLAKDPAKRPPNGASLRAELAEVIKKIGHPGGAAGGPALAPSLRERRLACVVMASEHDMSLDMLTTVPALDAERLLEPRAKARSALERMGAQVVLMSDGSLVGTVVKGETATDLAARAARAALAARELWPWARVTMVTGWGVADNPDAQSIAFDSFEPPTIPMRSGSSGAALKEPGEAGVWLDALSAGLLDVGFSISEVRGSWRLEGERDLTGGSRELLGKPTPFVGREQELSQITTVLESCVEESTAVAVLVTAPAGFGKSRLLRELLRRLEGSEARIRVLAGAADSMGAGSAFGRLAQASRPLRGAPIAPMPAGITSAEPVRASAEGAIIEWLRAECKAGPVLIVIDDFQWVDEQTVMLLDAALRELVDEPLMALALARPEIDERFPKLWNERGIQRIRLGSISRRASELFVAGLLEGGAEAGAVARIAEQARGNPLVLEELVRARGEGRGDSTPDTVLAILESTLLRLEPGARGVLKAGAVFGETFWRGGVAALHGAAASAQVIDTWLAALVKAEIIERRSESRVAGDVEYGFRSALLRDAAYGLLTDDDRALWHRMASEYRERVSGRDGSTLEMHSDDPLVSKLRGSGGAPG